MSLVLCVVSSFFAGVLALGAMIEPPRESRACRAPTGLGPAFPLLLTALALAFFAGRVSV